MPDGWDKDKALAEGVRLNVKQKGTGHPILLFHGGMGSWTHWIRNIDVLAEHFDVRAVDAPSYGESEQVDYGLTPHEYLQVFVASVNRIVEKDESFSIVGFSFGGACGVRLLPNFGAKVRAMTVIGPVAFRSKIGPPRLHSLGDVKTIRRLTASALKHNLTQLMLKHPESVDEDVLDMQHDNVERAKFNSRNGCPTHFTGKPRQNRLSRTADLRERRSDRVSVHEHRADLIREYVPDLKHVYRMSVIGRCLRALTMSIDTSLISTRTPDRRLNWSNHELQYHLVEKDGPPWSSH